MNTGGRGQESQNRKGGSREGEEGEGRETEGDGEEEGCNCSGQTGACCPEEGALRGRKGD